MGYINLMNADLANLIAAGEVIERPSSVVKELVENAIDAKATHIEVIIKEAGRKMIMVKDDGTGMDEIDACMAFKRHASSKVHSEYDLMSIKTLGFRGEALPSIAAISKVELVTSTGDKGTRVLLTPDKEMEVQDAKARKGSVFTVNELFYNTPARLKYLKSDKTEVSDIIEKVEHLALGYPDISFSLIIDDRQVLKTSGRGELLETIATIYGYETAKKMIPIDAQNELFSIKGYIAPPSITFATRYDILTFINNRSVVVGKAQKAIIDSYKDYIAPTRYPLTILKIKVDTSLVDVNVHPSKREVRLSSENELTQLLKDTIKYALYKTRPTFTEVPLPKSLQVDVVTFKSPDVAEIKEHSLDEEIQQLDEINNFEDSLKVDTPVESTETKTYQQSLFEQEVDDGKSLFDNLVPIGQILNTYIVCDGDDGFFLIDQHAAAERINYEKYEKEFSEVKETIEPLIPLVIEIPYSYIANIDTSHILLLKELGIVINSFGGNAVRVERIPLTLKDEQDESILKDIIIEALKDKKADITQLKRLAIATVACKASVKANSRLSNLEQIALIRELKACKNPANCPHGRPTIIKISKYEIEKMFKRTGF